MRKSVVAISLAVCLSGCALLDKIEAIGQDVDQGRVQGMTEENEFAYSIPNFHKGPYRGLNATFFLGKSRESGQWEVFYAMVEKDGKWESIPVKLTE